MAIPSRRRLAFVSLCAVLVSACGSEVTDPAVTSAGGAGGSGGSGGTGGSGGEGPCKRDFPGLLWSYETPDGGTWANGAFEGAELPQPIDGTGTVVESAPGELAVDFCPPNADCAPMVHRWTMASGDGAIDLAIPVGTFVRVELEITSAGYYQPSFTVLGWTLRNAPELGGVANPTEPGERLWAAVSSGTVHDPVTVTQGDARCDDNAGSWYRWNLVIGVAGQTIDLEEGAAGSVTVATGPHAGAYGVRNLQSHADQIEGAFPPWLVVTRQ